MATPLSADKMVAALRKEGVRVTEHSGWRTHNRAGHGAWGPVNGIVIHHTAGADSTAGLSLVYNGRSDLPGPLAHAYLGKSGMVTLTANGRANHAGSGDSRVLKAVVNETALPKPSWDDVDGNVHFYGIEIANLGNGKDPYPTTQYQAAVKWAAAICRAHGWSAKSVIGHKEWTNQKIDPSFSMTTFRKDVQIQLDGTEVIDPPPAKETTPVSTTTTPYPGEYYFEGYRTTPATLSTTGAWYDVTLTNEVSDDGQVIAPGTTAIGVPGMYRGVVWFEVAGVPEGDEIQVRIVERNATGGTTKTLPIVEGVGTGGSTYFAYPFAGLFLPSATAKTVAIQILNSTSSTSVSVGEVRIAGTWTRL